MKVFYHHIYEYEKGLRNLILHTTNTEDLEIIQSKLNKRKIPYLFQELNDEETSVFFGDRYCIDVIKSINKKNIKEYNDEEDFILGVMLGYGRIQQCQRYLKRKFATEIIETLIG